MLPMVSCEFLGMLGMGEPVIPGIGGKEISWLGGNSDFRSIPSLPWHARVISDLLMCLFWLLFSFTECSLRHILFPLSDK
ncbi:hypothetical protein Bca4012_036719 [Brassica carinata]